MDAAHESLLRIPLVAEMLADDSVVLTPRQVDGGWREVRPLHMAVSGFQPFLSRLFYPARSSVATWLADPSGPTRRLNLRDRLVKDVLMLAHDYLHIVAVRAIRTIFPGLGFGDGRIDADHLEQHLFCHIVTEAFATVGLDYWYLCAVDLPELVGLGTRVRTLTVSYHERHVAEYRRFRPALAVQDVRFFAELCRFYATGELEGFAAGDLLESPLLLHWLEHELRYGEEQRRIGRAWLAHLGGLELDPRTLARPIACDAPWQRELVDALGTCLWDLVKLGRRPALPPLVCGPGFTSPPEGDRPLDFRFTSVAALAPAELDDVIARGRLVPEGFTAFLHQRVAQLDLDRFDAQLAPLLATLHERRDFGLVHAFCKPHPHLAAQPYEPRHLLFPN
jgi:hypothetical protein